MKLSKTFLEDVRELILSARATVSRGVDLVQVHTNFKIGRRIVEQEQKGKSRAKYGEAVVKADGGHQSPSFGLSWTHYLVLLGIRDPDERKPAVFEQLRDDGPPILVFPSHSSHQANTARRAA